jgi:hypothetical protein
MPYALMCSVCTNHVPLKEGYVIPSGWLRLIDAEKLRNRELGLLAPEIYADVCPDCRKILDDFVTGNSLRAIQRKAEQSATTLHAEESVELGRSE